MATHFSIGVNAYEANVASRVGSNQFAYKILCELELLTRKQEGIAASEELDLSTEYECIVYLPTAPLDDMPKERPGWRYRILGPSFLWTQWRLPADLYFGGTKLDVFLSLGHYSPRFCPVPSCVCVLDLAFLKLPQFFRKRDLYQLREWTKYSVRAAKHVFTISSYSKNDIIETYKKSADNITIVYPGLDEREVPQNELASPNESDVLTRYSLEAGKYIVSVGTIQPRKNMINGIRAFETLVASGLELNTEPKTPLQALKLVFVGKSGWLTQDFESAVANSKVRQSIIITGFVDEVVKKALLRNAGCSILIGFYEGFGIPAVESLGLGVTPVVANTASLPEVVGEYGILVDPYAPESVARGLREALENPPGPMRKSQMHEWARQFSWGSSAKKILDVLRDKFGKQT